jgi:hypothetical protein
MPEVTEDIEITCECGNKFFFTVKDAEFYRRTFGENFSIPKRCKPCREARKAAKEREAAEDFGQGTRSGRFPSDHPNQGNKPKRQRNGNR